MDKPDSNQPQQTGGLKLMTVFIAVLALHVLVIGGFTVYHLMGSGSDADITMDKAHKLKGDGTAIADAATPDATAGDKSTDAATASTDTATSPSNSGTTTAAATAAPDATAAPVAATSPTNAPPPANAQAVTTTAPAPAPATASPAPAPASSSPIVLSKDDMSQTSTIPAGLVPPPDAPAVEAPSEAPLVQTPVPPRASTAATLAATAPSGPVKPSSPLAAGPVHMPAVVPKPAASSALAASPTETPVATHEEHIASASHEAKHEIYTVKITDSYKKIAHAHQITVAELKAANHIKDNVVLKTGEKLIIPESKTSVAKSGATHDSAPTGMTTSLTSTGATHHHMYTVAKGDTLRKIARKFNVSASAIEEANSLTDNKISVGEKLRIPSHESRNTASATPVREPSAAIYSTPEASVIPTPAPTPAPAPSAMAPSQVETQPAPVVQPPPAPVPAEPQPSATSNPELANLTF